MKYLKLDIKSFYKNKMIVIVMGVLLLVMIASPITVYLQYGRSEQFIENIGVHPFQFWLLMDSVSWGNSVWHALFWALPVISTGMIYYHEKSSSVYEMLLIRGSRLKYYFAKMLSQFSITFINISFLLLVNVVTTYLVFPMDAPLGEQYVYYIPKEEMFARYFYDIAPICEIVLYVVLNAFTIALLSLVVLAIHQIFVFKNSYMAFITPFIGLYVVHYITAMLLESNYELGIILQPKAAALTPNIIEGTDLLMVFGILMLFVAGVLVVGYKRNKDIC